MKKVKKKCVHCGAKATTMLDNKPVCGLCSILEAPFERC